ncbi:MAG TPA: hypothetical protein VFL29_00860 [Candidatus Dormibacteraeota bacterium]|nr:hypothetical protein [Candidatus Dormibacteraeota bacterium]
MLRVRRSLAGLIGAAAGLALVGSLFVAIPATATKGDIWTQPAGTPEETSGHSQEVHLPMGAVDIWADALDNHSGTWVLYHMPPPNPPGPDTEIARGTYSYPGSGSKTIATIPAATFQNAPGPHFKVEVDNDNKKSKTFWIESNTHISTTANPSSAVVGDVLKDTATLSNGIVPIGTITFTLYDPASAVAHTEIVTVNGNGSYATPTGHVANLAGTWQWQASYGGDGANAVATSRLGDEPVVVGKASPRISTTPNPTSAIVGATLKDSATLSGGFNPTGTITFTLYDPSNAVAHTESVTVAGNATYSTATGHNAGSAGTWHWKAEYSGDANNNAVASVASDEPVTVSEGEIIRVQPTIATTPNPSSAVAGATLKDSATLGGGTDPQGTITFTLYDPSDTAVYTEDVAVDGNGTYSTATGHVAASAGTWHWKADYSGDTHNKPASSVMADEPVVVTAPPNKVQPAIRTTPTPSNTSVGATLKDLATLSGGSNPTGTITFTLYDPSGTAVHTEQVNVAGNGSYQTPTGHVAPTQGTWHWKAEYSGDAANLPAASNPADEPVVVGPTGGVLAATGSTSPAQALAAALMAIGLLAILGALARRRREV